MIKLEIDVNDVKLDGGLIPRPVQITHGRSSIDNQPDAPTMSFEYLSEVAPCVVGDFIRAQTPLASGQVGHWGDATLEWADKSTTWAGQSSMSVRFYGKATRITSYEDLHFITHWLVECVGVMASLGAVYIQAEFPAQDEVQRVLAIAAAGGFHIYIAGTQALMMARDVVERDALSALHEVCKSTGGMLWQAKDGDIWYGTSNHRSDSTDWVLPASAITDGINWEASSDGILNALTIKYPQPELPPLPPTGAWNWVTSLNTGVDPGAGNFATNDEDINQVSQIAISDTVIGGADVTLELSRRQAGTLIYLEDNTNPAIWARFAMVDAAVDNGRWFGLTVDFKESSSSGTDPVPGHAYKLTFDSRDHEVQKQKTFEDAGSIAEWGRRHTDVETIVLDEDNARELALLILARRGSPLWTTSAVMLPLDDMSTPDLAQTQNLEFSTGLLAPVPTEPMGTPSALMQWAVEGWVEEYGEGEDWMQLALSNWSRTSPSAIRNYGTVRDTMTYAVAKSKTYHHLLIEVT